MKNGDVPLDNVSAIEVALRELLRLYDWRNELGRIERDFNHDRKQMKTWLNQYGREKKAAWKVAREVLQNAAPQVAPSTHRHSDPNATSAGPAVAALGNVSGGCSHPWRGEAPAPSHWWCCGVKVYRSYEDYVDD